MERSSAVLTGKPQCECTTPWACRWSRREHQQEGCVGRHGFRGHRPRSRPARRRRVPAPVVAPSRQLHARWPDDPGPRRGARWALRQRLVGHRLGADWLAALQGAIDRDQRLGLPVTQALRAMASAPNPENMGSTMPPILATGQHGDGRRVRGRLGRYMPTTRPGSNPQPAQPPAEAGRFAVKLGPQGSRPAPRRLRLPRPASAVRVARRAAPPVDAVEHHVGGPAHAPARAKGSPRPRSSTFSWAARTGSPEAFSGRGTSLSAPARSLSRRTTDAAPA